VDFFESSVGLAFLHRLVTGLHLVFNQVGPCGTRLISEYLELTRLDRFVGSSNGTQNKVARQIEDQIISYAQQEHSRLAETMAPKVITVCEDETYHPAICLVAIEPVSGLILVEKYVKHRDAETWNQAIEQATKDLPVEIIQSTSDEAKGILNHVQKSLGASHSPDLFHIQHDLQKATALTLRARVDAAAQEVEKAEKQRQEFEKEHQSRLEKGHRKATPPEPPKWLAGAVLIEQEARTELEVTEKQRDQMQAAIRGLGEVYHPYDPRNGQALSATDVQQRLNEQFTQIDQVAKEVGLSENSKKLIEKARRQIKNLVAVILFFHFHVKSWVKELSLSPEIEQFVLEELIPALYLEGAAKKLPTSEQRAKARAVYEPIFARARAPGNPLEKLDAPHRVKVEQVARQCADLFQRSSSCVEGRNGQLALRHHGFRQLSEKKLAALTAIHNFHLTRSDGTTAAQRFFGSKPTDLFSWLLDHVDVPVRPAAKRPQSVLKPA
jgi:hypothetical protein